MKPLAGMPEGAPSECSVFNPIIKRISWNAFSNQVDWRKWNLYLAREET